MALIEDPILNSPFREPARHFKFDEDGIIAQVFPTPRRAGPSGPADRNAHASVRGVRLQPDLDVLNLIIEVTGEARKDKTAKVTARTLWVPAVNNHGGFGRWAFEEVTDPWDAQRTI